MQISILIGFLFSGLPSVAPYWFGGIRLVSDRVTQAPQCYLDPHPNTRSVRVGHASISSRLAIVRETSLAG